MKIAFNSLMSQNWTRNVTERIFRQKWIAFEDNEILLSFKYIVLLSIYWMPGGFAIIPKYDMIYKDLRS